MIITRRRRRMLELISLRPRGVADLGTDGGFWLWRWNFYTLIRRFEDAGLVTCRVMPSAYGWDRIVYSITDVGRDACVRGKS